jgi:lysophospholipase L1-like esterase
MVVIILPTREEVYRDLTAPLMGAEAVDALGAPRRVMNALCQLEALTCLDLLPIFREYAAKGDALYYADDMHLNPTGNAVLAAEVERWLRQIGVLSPTRQN